MVTLVYEYSKPKEFNGFVSKIDQVTFGDLDEFGKYLNGEAAYDFLDNSVKKMMMKNYYMHLKMIRSYGLMIQILLSKMVLNMQYFN